VSRKKKLLNAPKIVEVGEKKKIANRTREGGWSKHWEASKKTSNGLVGGLTRNPEAKEKILGGGVRSGSSTIGKTARPREMSLGTSSVMGRCEKKKRKTVLSQGPEKKNSMGCRQRNKGGSRGGVVATKKKRAKNWPQERKIAGENNEASTEKRKKPFRDDRGGAHRGGEENRNFRGKVNGRNSGTAETGQIASDRRGKEDPPTPLLSRPLWRAHCIKNITRVNPEKRKKGHKVKKPKDGDTAEDTGGRLGL